MRADIEKMKDDMFQNEAEYEAKTASLAVRCSACNQNKEITTPRFIAKG